MRILFVSRLFLSGQTTHVVTLAEALHERPGVEVTLVTLGSNHPAAWQRYSVALRRKGIACHQAADVEQLHQIARQTQVDVIHCHSSDLIPAALRAARALDRPLVVTCHGKGVLRSQPRLVHADAVIAVGPSVFSELDEAGLSGIVLIGNGVDLNRFHPRPKVPGFDIAFVGRVDPTKRRGLYALIEAVGRIPRVHLSIASNDTPPAAPRCTNLGWIEDVAPLLARSDVVFGTGRAIREGLASGCVAFVLGAAYGGLVHPQSPMVASFPNFSGLNGRPIDSGQIRLDLLRLFQDRKRRAALSLWGRQYAQRHFCLADVVDRTVGVYRRVGVRG